ncbi:MAG: carbamate kinase [Thermoanaerobaculia bacterium]
MTRRVRQRVVVALGGNAITRPDGSGSVEEDLTNLRQSLGAVIPLLARGYQVVLTHGNGPQIGNMMVRNELSVGRAPDLPLPLMVADVQGGLGYLMQTILHELLAAAGQATPVATVITLVAVDPADPALGRPDKFVGPVLSEETARRRREDDGWVVAEDRGRGWRRVVPSPRPLQVLEAPTIERLVGSGAVVICCGGGGVPVTRQDDGRLRGMSGVVDKDFASAVLGRQIGAEYLFILTSVGRVQLGFSTASARPLATLRLEDARRYLAAGEFPAGSMGPKVEAACQFLEEGGEGVLITSLEHLDEALAGYSGTWVVPGP